MTAAHSDRAVLDIIGKTIRENYGIEGSLSRLPGENLNFLVKSPRGCKYVAKIVDDSLPEPVLEMQVAALKHAAERMISIQFPHIVENYNKHYKTRIKKLNNSCNNMIIMNYIEVNCLQDLSDISENLKMSLGATVAAFGETMRTFEHPAAHRSHRWDLTRADRHREVLSLLPERQKRSLLGWAFDSWTNGAAPFLHQLPWQFIHGDMNPENILVAQDEVVGLLDFGDGLFNPAVCDLAICLAYQMMDQSEPLVAARRTISGYESIRPLSDREHAVLLPLVLGRLAVTLSVATRRRQIDPGHANWYVSEAPAWRLLNTMFQRVRSEAKGLDGWCPVTP